MDQQIGFGLEDLKFIKATIETLSKRAAFEASELADIGLLYNRLSLFLSAAEASIKHSEEPKAHHKHKVEDNI